MINITIEYKNEIIDLDKFVNIMRTNRNYTEISDPIICSALVSMQKSIEAELNQYIIKLKIHINPGACYISSAHARDQFRFTDIHPVVSVAMIKSFIAKYLKEYIEDTQSPEYIDEINLLYERYSYKDCYMVQQYASNLIHGSRHYRLFHKDLAKSGQLAEVSKYFLEFCCNLNENTACRLNTRMLKMYKFYSIYSRYPDLNLMKIARYLNPTIQPWDMDQSPKNAYDSNIVRANALKYIMRKYDITDIDLLDIELIKNEIPILHKYYKTNAELKHEIKCENRKRILRDLELMLVSDDLHLIKDYIKDYNGFRI